MPRELHTTAAGMALSVNVLHVCLHFTHTFVVVLSKGAARFSQLSGAFPGGHWWDEK